MRKSGKQKAVWARYRHRYGLQVRLHPERDRIITALGQLPDRAGQSNVQIVDELLIFAIAHSTIVPTKIKQGANHDHNPRP